MSRPDNAGHEGAVSRPRPGSRVTAARLRNVSRGLCHTPRACTTEERSRPVSKSRVTKGVGSRLGQYRCRCGGRAGRTGWFLLSRTAEPTSTREKRRQRAVRVCRCAVFRRLYGGGAPCRAGLLGQTRHRSVPRNQPTAPASAPAAVAAAPAVSSYR